MEEQIRFKNHNGDLAGTLHLPDNPSQLGIVLGHCFTCTRHTTILRELAKDLTREGFIVLRFDFSGNGQIDIDDVIFFAENWLDLFVDPVVVDD